MGTELTTTASGEISRSLTETSTAAVAAQARALVEARFVLAMRRPRDMDAVRVALLKECSRPGFAAMARYSRPLVGSTVTGPSIRFAEAAFRYLGNLSSDEFVVDDNEERRMVRLQVMDLETNATHSEDVTVYKTVERSSVRKGQTVRAKRTNSDGRDVYIIEATDDELAVKQGALMSKAFRNAVLKILPADITDECMARVAEVVTKGDKADPDAARKQLVDAFARVNVSPAALKEYLGHEIATCSPVELANLRQLWTAINAGEATWQEVFDERRGASS